MSWMSVMFVLTWKANKKDNVYAAMRSRNPQINFQVNNNFVFKRCYLYLRANKQPTFGEKKLLFDVFCCHEFLPRAFEKVLVAQLAAK